MTLLAELSVSDSSMVLREAVADDVPAIVELLAADQLGASRDGASDGSHLQPYLDPFHALDTDPAHLLVVASDGPHVLATMQLSFLPGLARRGARRAQIAAVRVRQDYRSQGLGAAMFRWAIGEARRRGCALVQLTTDKSRRRSPLLRPVGVRRLPRGPQAAPVTGDVPQHERLAVRSLGQVEGRCDGPGPPRSTLTRHRKGASSAWRQRMVPSQHPVDGDPGSSG